MCCCVPGSGRADGAGWWWLVLDYQRAGSSLFLCQGGHRGTHSGSRKIRCVKGRGVHGRALLALMAWRCLWPAPSVWLQQCSTSQLQQDPTPTTWCALLAVRPQQWGCGEGIWCWGGGVCFTHISGLLVATGSSGVVPWRACDAHLIWPAPNWNTEVQPHGRGHAASRLTCRSVTSVLQKLYSWPGPSLLQIPSVKKAADSSLVGSSWLCSTWTVIKGCRLCAKYN